MLRYLRRPSLACLPRLPLATLLQLSECRTLSLFYHTSFESPPPYFANLYAVKSPEALESDLDSLLRAGLKPLSMENLLAAEDPIQLPKGSFFLSFDDGYREMAETIAPILRRKGIPATFFLTSSLIDNEAWLFEDQIGLIKTHLATMDSSPTLDQILRGLRHHGHTIDSLASCRVSAHAVIEELGEILEIDWTAELHRLRPYLTSPQVEKLLADGFMIGAHGVDHSLFARLSYQEQFEQVRASMDTLANRYALETRVFAFPYTEHGVARETLERIREARIVDALFGTRGLIEDELHPFLRQRIWAEDHAGSLRGYLKQELAQKVLRRCRRRDRVTR